MNLRRGSMAGACMGLAGGLLFLSVLPAIMSIEVSAQSRSSSNEELALVGATLYPSPTDEPVRDGIVLIRGGKIAAAGSRSRVPIPASFRPIDCSGASITAGFWNSHVHFFERKWANASEIPAPELTRQLQDMYTRYGFTAVFDLSSLWENTRRIRGRIESGEVSGPRIYSTGEGLVAPGTLPVDAVLSFMGLMKTPLPEIVDASQAAAASKKLLEAGVDGIKLFASSPSGTTIPPEAIEAATKEAHAAGKPAFVHPNTAADVMAAVRSGVDIIAHTTPRSGPWDAALLAAMRERQAALTPTLTLWKYYLRHDRLSTQEQVTNTAIGQLKAWVAAGGTVLFGTDAGAVEYDPSEEYGLMADAGMSFRQILASLTTAPAERFGAAGENGRITVGAPADLVVLKGDPSVTLRSLAAVRYTLRAGKIVYRSID